MEYRPGKFQLGAGHACAYCQFEVIPHTVCRPRYKGETKQNPADKLEEKLESQNQEVSSPIPAEQVVWENS